jgi:uncharacterized membrane protein YGL010W
MKLPSPHPSWMSHVEGYAKSHGTPINKLLHFLGIPLLAIALLGLLSKLSLQQDGQPPALQPNAAWVVLLGLGFWYLWLDWRMGIPTIVLLVGCYVLGSWLSLAMLLALFGAGAGAHLIGHYGFEGKPPALLSRPVAVLEAPAWLLSIWIGLFR